MEISIRVPPCRPIRDLIAFARRLEGIGVDRVVFPDSQLLWRDVAGQSFRCPGDRNR
jgi:5,10-methylenetetrahydromethanopterin reductase